MRILVVAPTPFFSDRGTHIRILEEALALERLGHDITIATYHIGKDLPKDLDTKIDVRRIRRLLFWYKKLEAGPDWQKIVLDLMLIRKVFFLARTQKPDIIHAHLHEGVAIGWIVQKLLFWRKIKLVADFHGSLTKEMVSHAYLGNSLFKKVFQWVEHWIDNLGNAAVASSWENTQEIRSIRKKNSTETVLDGVVIPKYQDKISRNRVRARFGLSPDDMVVTYTGALIPNKGIRYFIESIPLVLEQKPETHFIIAGFPMDQIQSFFEGKSWSSSVVFISPLNYFESQDILQASDIGVDPKDISVRQASGKMLQYMGAGLPVACFDTMNNREYLGEAHPLAKDISAKGLANVILELLRDSEIRKDLGAGNADRAKQFSWDISVQKLDKIYRKLSDV